LQPHTAIDWPPLPLAEWEPTRATLHMWTQIVGKIRLALAPMVNHWWQVPLYVTARGLTTSPMPHGHCVFQIDFDFVDHLLRINVEDGATRTMALEPRSVADFYTELMARLRELELYVRIWTRPQEVETAIPFELDNEHASYDADQAHRFFLALVQVDRVLKRFRSGFLGKCSPVHFFWGGFDMAVTRFSGRTAPPHPGGIPNAADWVMREAYSHEVSSAGWWPGGGHVQEALFYAYAYPEPAGFANARIRPVDGYYDTTMREFFLPYESVRQAADPDALVLDFLQSTYEAIANLGGWPRETLERQNGESASQKSKIKS
jgi:hypothetical protein